jgi:signal transduction histidine kinase
MKQVFESSAAANLPVRNLLSEAPFSTALLTGPELIITLANERSLQLWGKDEGIIGKRILDALPEMGTQPFYQLLKSVYETGETFEGKESTAYLEVNGELKLIYVNFVFKAMHDDHGNITGVLATGYDVTDLVEARKKMADAEERARLAIEAAGLGTFDFDHVTQRGITSPVFDAMFGFQTQQRPADYIARIHPDDKHIRLKAMEQAAHTGNIFYEARLLLSDQTIRWVRINGKIYYDELNRPIRTVGTALDFTDQHLSLKELEESEERFRTLITEAPEVASGLYIGHELRIRYVNDIMLRFWDKDASIIGKTIREAMPELGDQPFLELLDNVFKTGLTYSGKEEKAMLFRNGKLEASYYNYTYKALRNAAGEIYGIHHMAHEVTDTVIAKERLLETEKKFREELEFKIRERTQELERSNDELQQFAYVASHDLQEPLRKIATFSELLQKTLGDISPTSRDYLNRISKSTLRMLGLIKDVLNYSRVTRRDAIFKTVRLNDILNDVLNDYELLIAEKRATIEVEDLPQIQGIPTQINQLFNNLLSNSLKFSDDHRDLRITIRCRPLSTEELISHPELNSSLTYVKMEWEDNGIGFEQHYAEQVFEIFERLNSQKEYAGSGIGLAICKRIVTNHDGKISSTSNYGKGTTFHIYLPSL